MKLFSLFIPLILLLLCPLTSIAEKSASSNKKGVESYSQKNYEESVKHFTDALVERPNSPELRYNLGTALSAIGEKKDEALKELSIAAESTDNRELSTSAHYNMGNKLLLSGDLEESINEYKKALKLDQTSKDIRHNLELAVKKLQHQQQNEEENQDSKKKEENEDEKQNNQDNENKEENKQEQNDNQQSKTENSEKEQPQDQQQQQSNQQNSENQPMTEEEAQRILDAMNNEEKKALSLRRMQMQTEMMQGDDW